MIDICAFALRGRRNLKAWPIARGFLSHKGVYTQNKIHMRCSLSFAIKEVKPLSWYLVFSMEEGNKDSEKVTW
jgi:hypothetical protein